MTPDSARQVKEVLSAYEIGCINGIEGNGGTKLTIKDCQELLPALTTALQIIDEWEKSDWLRYRLALEKLEVYVCWGDHHSRDEYEGQLREIWDIVKQTLAGAKEII